MYKKSSFESHWKLGSIEITKANCKEEYRWTILYIEIFCFSTRPTEWSNQIFIIFHRTTEIYIAAP